MSTVVRQQALLVAEAWQNIYTNQSYVDFQSYNQDNLVNAILNYVQINYPDNYNDWITNSEFIIKVRTLAWLHQNISYRIDLDIRENFVQTATRRDAILMLAENVFYKPNRVTGANGELRVESILTNQTVVDSNGETLTNLDILWNDPANPDWFEQFSLVMNAALTPRTQFGHPLSRYNKPPTRTDLYMFNSRAPSGGLYPFSVQIADTVLPFGYINVTMDKDTGVLSEIPPNPTNALRIIYRSDGRGSGSANTGFFLPVRQGVLNSFDQIFSVPQSMQQVILGTTNVDNGNVFVQQIDSASNIILNWTEVASLYGQGVSFNNFHSDIQTIFETHTLMNDQVRVQFGDGKFGAIPADGFRFWYRTVNPTPLSVQPSDIQRQSFVIPYVSNVDGALYFLTIRASLVAPITNAIPTDSNATIKANMGGAYAAQRRMVTASDYNLFPLSDPSILKLKAVNRTYSGHSAYAKIYDPTGLYNGIKVLAEDGRLYRDDPRKSTFVSALTSQVTLDELVLQHITPLIQSSDKQSLYYNRYDEILCIDNPTWAETSMANGISSGNIHKFAVTIPVGPTAADEFKYLVPGTFIRYTSLAGPLISVQQVVGDGTEPDGISLTGALATATALHSLMPPLRNHFTNDEQTEIKTELYNLQDFGLSWNQSLQEWTLISNADLNKSGSFDITNQGDHSNTGKDASWMIYLRYIPNGGDGPLWEILDRGMGVFFESAREVEFVYVNTGPVVNPDTGRLVHDNINILGSNEGRDSLPRLGLYQQGPCCPLIYNFTANGTDTCYQIRNSAPQDEIFVFVDNKLVGFCTDYNIHQTPIGDEICFYSTPLLGQTISIRVGGSYRYATQYLVSETGDGSTKLYGVADDTLLIDNTFVSLDGVTQQGGSGYYVSMQGTLASLLFPVPPAAGVHIQGYAGTGPQTSIFVVMLYPSDGFTTFFDTGYAGQTIDNVAIFIDGIWQAAGLDYTIDNSLVNSWVIFTTAPHAEATIAMHVCPIPGMVTTSMYTSVGNGVTTFFAAPKLSSISYNQIIVGINGIVQHDTDFTISSTGITFGTAPEIDNRVEIFVLRDLAGHVYLDQNNTCYTTYIGDDKIFYVTDVELTPDGYTDIDGVEIAPSDSDLDGISDNPYQFEEILIPDGLTDLVLWRSVIKDGFMVWNPIDETTVPKGTYGFSNVTKISENLQYDTTATKPGDIHLDQTTQHWLVADGFSKTWIYNDTTQTDYKSAIGRSGLKFIWTHYPADDTRIDPAISNIIDLFVLPVSYDTAYRQWIASGFIGAAPGAPSVQSLQNEYDYLNNYRMTDDGLIFRPINYRPLFGAVAETQYQATFLAIKAGASLLSDNDLILRIINAIDIFFQASNWELGESFYLTELIAFIHRAMAPDLQSVVLVAKDGSPFGDMFQIRSAPDELFISVAQPSDVKIVTNFNADNLQILSTAI